MPDSRSERIAFAFGLAAILALAIALIPAYAHYRSSGPSAPSVALRTSPPAEQTAYRPRQQTKAAATVQPQRTHRTTPAKTRNQPVTAAVAPVTKPKPTKLSFAATRGDCWVEVRAGSATGKILYVGTLAKGKSYQLVVTHLWVRFGAPQNVDLTIGGKPASLPGGSQDFLVTPKGITASA